MKELPFIRKSHVSPAFPTALAALASLLVATTATAAVQSTAEAVQSLIASMVQIPGKDYKIGSTEVTRVQWKAVMGSLTNYRGMNVTDSTANRPMVNVSWEDCQAFITKLNALPAVKEAGLTFRLPTADEWEFACRAGTRGKYCKAEGGRDISAETLGDVAWFVQNSWREKIGEDGKKEKEDISDQPVASKKPNAFGLYDMIGNVWEWTATVTEDGKDRVFCGGYWDSPASQCEASIRYRNLPTYWEDFLGLRLCATASSK